MNRQQRIITRRYTKELKLNWKGYVGILLFATFLFFALGLAGRADFIACTKGMC